MEPVEIRTDRLLLRPWQPSDAPAVLAACTDPLVQAWTSGLPSPYTAESAREYVEVLAPGAWAADAAYAFAVTDRDIDLFGLHCHKFCHGDESDGVHRDVTLAGRFDPRSSRRRPGGDRGIRLLLEGP